MIEKIKEGYPISELILKHKINEIIDQIQPEQHKPDKELASIVNDHIASMPFISAHEPVSYRMGCKAGIELEKKRHEPVVKALELHCEFFKLHPGDRIDEALMVELMNFGKAKEALSKLTETE